MTLDLFEAPILPGLRTASDFIDRSEEAALIAGIDRADLEPFKFQGWTGRRLTASFGWSYDFEVGRLRSAPPVPGWLIPLRERAAVFAGLDAEALVQTLIIRYDPGAGIGWHRDRAIYEEVIGVSLGEPATMRFRQRRAAGFLRAVMPLEPRSAYFLSGAARHDWEHSITPLARPRWSITFRSLSVTGRRSRTIAGAPS